MNRIEYKDQRVGIFIDIQNLYHSAKNIYASRVNYKELIKSLVGKRSLVWALAYVVKSDTSSLESHISKTTGKSEASFFDALEKSGIRLRVKDLQIFAGGAKKADWDVGLAVDAIRMSTNLDVIVLVTGDGDFIPLVEYLKWGMGKVVEVAGFSKSASSKIKETADFFINIEEIPRALTSIKE
ncbi:MAG: hypothetical protein A2430_02370 [Candidatus Liptonbacteria bacterium RIFOXYC1_FULL_36_8]|uniref:NYN domain-containing protein n=3 Tax=Candidatus Liptoniibacteriota TaxID=1817909 RepID=A0A1G2CQH8_9BACT|nr:MAG: hypothetical protein A2430_02370 [Candidatus Liptonbacteria bacterium RIFOXYC1_FULL_36_8]OGZ02901.1 MAG: hypothetical protein A2390_01385 [Candidatus Liptonbacteria bacterium RIFOXYB1_FULL_36_10]OGZ03220.1 MAG: hypothetical protein A2604_01910 [Candidatus Liptonbacteria bacterium RIFOXYD1_FULL_36_11]